MFTSVDQFVASWRHESASTQRVLETLTNESLAQEVTPGYRSLGQIGWHIGSTIHEMLSRTGLVFPNLATEEKAPAEAEAIARLYRQSSEAMLEALQSQWTDEDLLRHTNMYGEEWPNGLTLHALIQHEIHHRGQMTVLMRQAGLRVPDIYGPTREQWLEQGVAPLL